MNNKKQSKKFLRGMKLLKKDLNCCCDATANEVELCTSSDSKHVAIVNGGLTTGLDEVMLMKILNSHGFNNVEKVCMIPRKQYCFISFNCPEEASNAVETLSGKEITELKRALYMECINNVPNLKCLMKFETPPGLTLLHNFISEEEEEMLVNMISWDSPISSSSEGSSLKHREVRHFGYEFKYGSNSVDKKCPLEKKIPEQLIPICLRIKQQGLMSSLPDQLTVNKYLPNQGIPPHVDTHQSFTGEILSLTVNAGTTMDFYRQSDADCTSESGEDLHYAVYLPRRSLCIMTGPSRYEWTHGIRYRKTDVVPDPQNQKLTLIPRGERISFTFRKLKEDGPCNCSYPKLCDSQIKENEIHLDADTASQLEKLHVQNVYEKIAPHFSQTRHKPWPKVLQFVQDLNEGSFLLDVGCGNGKYLGQQKDIYKVGCDASFNLLNICKDRKFEIAQANCLNLPFRDESFDAVICIAVIHHLASKDRRKKSLEEINRVLRVGGEALIYVWAFEQKMGTMSAYLKQMKSNRKSDRTAAIDQKEQDFKSIIEESSTNEGIVGDKKISLMVHKNRTEFVAQDMFVPWKVKPQKSGLSTTNEAEVPTFNRFYHLFKRGELEELCESIFHFEIIKSYYDEGNWCIIVKKLKE